MSKLRNLALGILASLYLATATLGCRPSKEEIIEVSGTIIDKCTSENRPARSPRQYLTNYLIQNQSGEKVWVGDFEEDVAKVGQKLTARTVYNRYGVSKDCQSKGNFPHYIKKGLRTYQTR